jgi:ribonuclease-3
MTYNENWEKIIEALEKAIGYSFRSKELLRQALTHKSFRYEQSLPIGADNENLEFLGDAILGFIVSKLLYQLQPTVEVGTLAKMKSYLVSSKTLSWLAKKINLGNYLFLSKGEEKTKGRKKKSLLENSYEALIAAIYLDAGLATAERFIQSQFHSLIEDVIHEREEFRDFKSMLQEHLQSLKLTNPHYHILKQTGPDHKKRYFVELTVNNQSIAQAEGKSKKEAEKYAAKRGLQLFKNKKS